MDGRIDLESVPGDGATFRLIVPMEVAPEGTSTRKDVDKASPPWGSARQPFSAAPPGDDRADGAQTNGAQSNNTRDNVPRTIGVPPHATPKSRDSDQRLADTPPRILIAEDNTVNQSVALQQLRQLGDEADVVSNGREALGAVEQYAYEVILMDVQMPEMDDLEATRRIKRAAHQGALTGAPESATSAPPHVIVMTASALKDDRAQCSDAGMDDYVRKPVTVNALADALRRAPTRETPSQDGGA